MSSSILIVIPARGGSKGIPRKNLRLLGGKPLIYYSIKTALASKFSPDVYISSEDEEILNIALQFGAKIHKRDISIADDKSTLDPVVFACYQHAKKVANKNYDYIITMQPTSPLLKTESLDRAIEQMLSNKDIETIIAAKESTQLSWRKINNKFIPNYEKRVNRQYLTPTYSETGAFLITKKEIITSNSRIGKSVELSILYGGEEIDVDTYEDWSLCEYYLKRKHILFVVTGNNTVGLGHVYNTLLLANDILNHQISFLVDKNSSLAFKKISSKNYSVFMQKNEDILEDIKKINPSVVINDILDTSTEYIKKLKHFGLTVINFEDLGGGAKYANLVINAIYPEQQILKNHYFGQDYFVLRDEFIYQKQKKIEKTVKNILVTFGGVDPNNYTKKVIESIYPYCLKKNIKITVVAGFGYDKFETLERFKGISIKKNVLNISNYMLQADIVFTSAGRTIYEIASLGVPAIVMAQNDRETSHFFANIKYGFLNLGLGHKISLEDILLNFKNLVISYETRDFMSKLMKKYDLKHGRKTVIKLLKEAIEG